VRDEPLGSVMMMMMVGLDILSMWLVDICISESFGGVGV
jgi:hypothetical protein